MLRSDHPEPREADGSFDPSGARIGGSAKRGSGSTITGLILEALRSGDPSLSPLERRLVEIARELWPNAVILAQCKNADGPTRELSVAVAVEGAQLALAAAIEIEGSLRQIRDEARRL